MDTMDTMDTMDSSPKYTMDTMAGADETKTCGPRLGDVINPQPIT